MDNIRVFLIHWWIGPQWLTGLSSYVDRWHHENWSGELRRKVNTFKIHSRFIWKALPQLIRKETALVSWTLKSTDKSFWLSLSSSIYGQNIAQNHQSCKSPLLVMSISTVHRIFSQYRVNYWRFDWILFNLNPLNTKNHQINIIQSNKPNRTTNENCPRLDHIENFTWLLSTN